MWSGRIISWGEMFPKRFPLPRRVPGVALAAAVLAAGWVAAQDNPAPVGGAAAPQFAIRTWDTDNGLPASDITCIARTPDGYLWLATGAGLVRFDGMRFTVLTTNQLPGLGTNPIAALGVTRRGVLWVADQSGQLVRREDGRFEAVKLRVPEGLARASSLPFEPDGALWLGTWDCEPYRVEPASARVELHTNGLARGTGPLLSLLGDARGGIWAISQQKLMSHVGGRWKPALDRTALPLEIQALAASSDGGLWIATISGHPLRNRGARVFKFKDGRLTDELQPYPWTQDLTRIRVTAIFEDASGRLWMGTRGGGVFHWAAGNGWQRLPTEGPLAQLPINCIAEDGEGSLWIASQNGGLHQVTSRPVTSLRLPPGAEANIVLSAAAARDGSVWFGTDAAGVFEYRDGRFLQHTNGLANLQVGVVFEDRRKNLWAGTWQGLHRWNGRAFEVITNPPAMREVVLGLCDDAQGNLWVATSAGLVRWRDGDTKVYWNESGIDHGYLRAVVVDRDDRVWVAITDRGLYRQNGEQFEPVAAHQWPGASTIRALHADT